ncbi:glycine--tRNA ligase subunit beta [Aquincola sp. S2]|uniref:Glycine--tRNA ligase beta subunit n=1 Tax=Pseudaquabacterium terrae TaxID=2732868 RepID=A0ABX2EBW2_9BURK|nr:glycine--tRNA ligase subunit beta [Aquabacterium terrae]NRF66091.1 glycine--tRNA ligase subunit beta [Aquabacterium terrae]
MSTNKNLLVELFVEELPPKALKKLGESFAATLAASLQAQGLIAAGAAVMPFASPRRLAVHVASVAAKAADKPVQQKLMPVAVALDASGAPTQALLKKLAALGAGASVVPTLKRAQDGKAEALFLDSVVAGATLAEGLQRAFDEAISKLPIPKVMSYQLADGWSSVNFVRPAHGLVALHGDQVVPISALGLNAGRTTQGHRFEASVNPVVLRNADTYAAQLESEGAVIASFDARRAEINRQLAAKAAEQGLQPIDDDALLDEVCALVERPNVLLCRFEEEFLAVPQECLILTMKANQKYFPLLDSAGRLTHKFLVVSNIRPADASAVIGGNERVVRPRLADAKFFFDQDRKKPLAERVGGLDKVVYHNKLGTQGERSQRVRSIARGIGLALGGEVLAAAADRAALLAKADLLTDMVGEFPELQGVMGGYYARHDGETEDIALAIEDHYRPRFAGDALPRHPVGLAVALADKLETLAGLFGIGQIPTGDKDPFALRRHALGVIRMLIEAELPLEIHRLVGNAFGAFAATHGQAQAEVGFFLRERLAGYLREQGYSAQEVDAVVEARPERWAEIPKRLAAVRAFAALPEAASLAAANKRVGNILKKSEAGAPVAVQAALLREPAEAALHEALQAVQPAADAAFARGDYSASLQALAALKAPVDAFFDTVMVNADDAALRNNRLALLAGLHAAMNRVADLSRLAS